MTEKELDKILTSVLGQKPNVSAKSEKRAKKPAEGKKAEPAKEKTKTPDGDTEKPKAPTHLRKNNRAKAEAAKPKNAAPAKTPTKK